MLINSINLEFVGDHVEAGNMGTRRYLRRQAKQAICTELIVLKHTDDNFSVLIVVFNITVTPEIYLS